MKLPNSITADREKYRSFNLLERPVSFTSTEYLERFYSETNSEIASTGLIVGNKYIYLSLDLKDTLDQMKSTKIYKIPLSTVNEDFQKREDVFERESLKFGTPTLVDEIDNKGCTKSTFIPALNIIVRICRDELNVIFKLSNLNSNVVDILLIDVFQGSQIVVIEDYSYLILPSSDPQKV